VPQTLTSFRLPPDTRVGRSGADGAGTPLRFIVISFLPGRACDTDPDECGPARG